MHTYFVKGHEMLFEFEEVLGHMKFTAVLPAASPWTAMSVQLLDSISTYEDGGGRTNLHIHTGTQDYREA